MRTSCVATQHARLVALLVILLCEAFLVVGTVAAKTVLATPEGTIVTGKTAGLTVGEVDPPLAVDVYLVPEAPAAPLPDPPPGSMSTLLWGYTAAVLAGTIHTYDIAASPSPATGMNCVPPGSLNGRGLAMDPMDGNLWYTFVMFPGFTGDGLIHKTNPPNTASPCTLIASIPFADGPGGTIQDDIGALEIDQGSKHIWAAGYKPVIVGGVARSYLYLVNRNNGQIIHSCWVPFGGGGVGNDTLAYARIPGLPGSGQYLLTDAGEIATPLNSNSLAVIDTAECKNGDQVAPVTSFPKSVGMTGIDFEWPGLLATDLFNLYNLGGPPFSIPVLIGPTGAVLEDIGLCGFRAKLGGDGADFCPY